MVNKLTKYYNMELKNGGCIYFHCMKAFVIKVLKFRTVQNVGTS